jgi:hypothetical protein
MLEFTIRASGKTVETVEQLKIVQAAVLKRV